MRALLLLAHVHLRTRERWDKIPGVLATSNSRSSESVRDGNLSLARILNPSPATHAFADRYCESC